MFRIPLPSISTLLTQGGSALEYNAVARAFGRLSVTLPSTAKPTGKNFVSVRKLPYSDARY